MVDPLIGRQLGDFLVRRRHAEGGVGAIYLAEQPALGRQAVIKVLRPELRDEEARREHFLEEARLAARLGHPYAAHVYAFGAEDDGLLWIAMEAVDGLTLADEVRTSGAIAPDVFAPLLNRLCEVVDAAHAKGIVHCDIKPANVMIVDVGGTRIPKLLDFGIAATGAEVTAAGALAAGGRFDPDATRELDPADRAFLESLERRIADLSLPDTPSIDGRGPRAVGTPAYMAPERWLGRAMPASDVYALGVVAYVCVAARGPFAASNADALRRAHFEDEVPPLGPGLEPFDPVLRRALSKRPEDRFPSAGELARAFTGALAKRSHPQTTVADEGVRRLESTFPGIATTSPVQAWCYLEGYAEGIETHRRLDAPTAADDRWAGVCHFQLVEDVAARERLERAVSRGDGAAKMDLAHLLLHTEDTDGRANRLLSEVDENALTPADRCRFLRIRGSVAHNRERPKEALVDMREAWVRVQGLPEYPVLAPWIAVMLGSLSVFAGDARRAVRYLDRAFEISLPGQRAKLSLVRMLALLTLGLHREVLAAFARLDADAPGALRTEALVYAGEAHLALGDTDAARDALTEAADAARDSGTAGEEIAARLWLAMVATCEKANLEARRQLARARRVVRDEIDRLMLSMREAVIEYRAGRLPGETALARLDEAAGGFRALERPIGLARTLAHAYAIACAEHDEARADALLDELDLAIAELDLESFLEAEWRPWPEARAHAEAVRPGMFPSLTRAAAG